MPFEARLVGKLAISAESWMGQCLIKISRSNRVWCHCLEATGRPPGRQLGGQNGPTRHSFGDNNGCHKSGPIGSKSGSDEVPSGQARRRLGACRLIRQGYGRFAVLCLGRRRPRSRRLYIRRPFLDTDHLGKSRQSYFKKPLARQSVRRSAILGRTPSTRLR